jgi:DNA-binding NarL/FixJ family response regulator
MQRKSVHRYNRQINFLSELHGRDREVAAATAVLARRGVVCIRGEIGAGKSTLAGVVAAATGRRVHSGTCLATLSWMPGLPLAMAIRLPLPRGDATCVARFVSDRIGDGVLVVDDVEWADGETARLLPLCRGRFPTILTCTSQGDRYPEAAALAEACDATFIDLGAVDDASAVEIVRECNPKLVPNQVRQIVAGSGGNPLLLREQALAPASDRDLGRLIDRRLSECSAPALEALSALALLGRPAAEEELPFGVAELVEQGLVERTPGPRRDSSTVRLRHAIFGTEAVRRMSDDDRRHLHVVLSERLGDEGERARHLYAAGHREDALQAALAAAAIARRPAERARHVGLAASCSYGTQSVKLHVAAAEEFLAVGEYGAAERHLGVLDDPEVVSGELLAETSLLRARLANARGGFGAALDHVEAGLAADPAGLHSTDLRIERVLGLSGAGRYATEARIEARALVAEARQAGGTVAGSLLALGAAEMATADSRWIATMREALSAARDEGRFDLECNAARLIVTGSLLAGDPEEAAALAGEMRARCRERLSAQWEQEFSAADLWVKLFVRGELEDAIALAEELLGEQLSPGLHAQVAALYVVSLADRGRLAEAHGAAEDGLRRTAGSPNDLLRWARAEARWLGGDRDRALAEARELVDAPHPVAALAGVTGCWALAEQNLRPDNAQKTRAYGGSSEELTALPILRSEPGRAGTGFSVAAELWRGRQLRSVMRCCWAMSEAAAAAGDLESARRLSGETRERAEDLRFQAMLPRLQKTERAAGVPAPRSAPSRDGRLTGREKDVLELVAAGLRSGEVAARLQITTHTVEEHVASAMAKLGASTRTEAVTLMLAAGGGPARAAVGPPVLVVEDSVQALALSADLRASGYKIHNGFVADRNDFWPAASSLVCVGTADDEESRQAAILAGAQGAGLLVMLPKDSPVPDTFLRDLDRIAVTRGQRGGADWHGSAAGDGSALSAEMTALLRGIGRGRAVADVAQELNMSLRSAHRRLAEARTRLGVKTTAAAVAEEVRRREAEVR